MSEAPQPVAPETNVLARARAAFMGLTLLQRWIAGGLIAAFILVLLLALGGGGGRQIVVNGQRLGAQEIAYFDAAAGARVPNGAYWFDPASGAFGRVGDMAPRGALNRGAAPQAPIAQQAPYGQNPYAQSPYAQAPPQQPQHWGDVGQNDRGPFGDYMSDGQCSFVNGVAVGNC